MHLAQYGYESSQFIPGRQGGQAPRQDEQKTPDRSHADVAARGIRERLPRHPAPRRQHRGPGLRRADRAGRRDRAGTAQRGAAVRREPGAHLSLGPKVPCPPPCPAQVSAPRIAPPPIGCRSAPSGPARCPLRPLPGCCQFLRRAPPFFLLTTARTGSRALAVVADDAGSVEPPFRRWRRLAPLFRG